MCYSGLLSADFAESGGSHSKRWFVEHEWCKHGVCAGTEDYTAYFDQICTLSQRPLAVMQTALDKQDEECNDDDDDDDNGSGGECGNIGDDSKGGKNKSKNKSKSDLDRARDALEDAGFPLWGTTDYSSGQIQLSACAEPGRDGAVWKICAVEEFEACCGKGGGGGRRGKETRGEGRERKASSSSVGRRRGLTKRKNKLSSCDGTY